MVLGAGSSTELSRAWVLGHEGNARITVPMWIDTATGWAGPIEEMEPANDEVMLEDLQAGLAAPHFQLAG